MTRKKVIFSIDGKKIEAFEGESLISVAKKFKIFIPTLCFYKEIEPSATCRICTIKLDGQFRPACMAKVTQGMCVENETQEIFDLRSSLLEMILVEGNHICPICEKSGNCDLQALAYKYQIMAPRFPFLFHKRPLKADIPHLLLDLNRCIQCQRCIKGIKKKDGKEIFGLRQRGQDIVLSVDPMSYDEIDEDLAKLAEEICPVGAILKKERGFKVPIGERKYDFNMIGEEEV